METTESLLNEQILFGKTISTFRNEKQWNLSVLAEKAGIAVGYLSRLEKDKQRPSLDVLESICKALGIPLQVMILEATINQKSDNPDIDDMREALRPIFKRIMLKVLLSEKSEIDIDLNSLMVN